MSELAHYIGSYFGITVDEAVKFTSFFKPEQLKKGDFFVRKGQYCDRMSFLNSGYMRIFSIEGDKEITQWISRKGYFVTELSSFMFQQRARFNIQALTDCKFYSIHQDAYFQLEKHIANWPQVERQFISACFITLEDRVFQHLSLSSEQRYNKLFESDKELFQEVPLQYIASMLGMSPETLSRIRAKQNS